jgi:gliding motility-associated-like protein
MKHFAVWMLFLCFGGALPAQVLLNGDLVGDATEIGSLPHLWENVPYTDPVCQATEPLGATPDLSPYPPFGIYGIPHSGPTFVSGLLLNSGSLVWHEGIMQEVSGFTPDSTYTVHFYQAVVKQANALDSHGAWEVFLDDQPVGISALSYSPLPHDTTPLIWTAQALRFTATSATHTLKFLPYDDDLNSTLSPVDSLGGLRMGIDSIYIERSAPCDFSFSLGQDTSLCAGTLWTLYPPVDDALCLWQDVVTAPSFTVKDSGEVRLQIISDGCSYSDTLRIGYEDCQGDLVMSNVFTPNGDGINDYWVPVTQKNIRELTTQIFDRWGRRLYTTENLNVEWGGQLNGTTPAAPGTYYWIAEFVDTAGEKGQEKGTITLLR